MGRRGKGEGGKGKSGRKRKGRRSFRQIKIDDYTSIV